VSRAPVDWRKCGHCQTPKCGRFAIHRHEVANQNVSRQSHQRMFVLDIQPALDGELAHLADRWNGWIVTLQHEHPILRPYPSPR